MKRSAFALVTVTSLVSLLTLMSFELVKYFSGHLSMTNRQERMLRARAAASGGLSRALDELRKKADWRAGFPETAQAKADSSYRVNFQALPGLPFSLNNEDGQSSKTGWGGRGVPANSALLVAEGRSGTVGVRECALVDLGQVLMEDNFQRYSGQWTQADGNAPVLLLGKYVLDLRSLLHLSTHAGDENWKDYRFQASSLVTSGTGFGLLVRVTGSIHNPSGYWVTYDALDGLLEGGSFRVFKLKNGRFGPPEVRVTRKDAGMGGLLALQWLLNLEHVYEVTIQDNQLTLNVDGKRILSWKDEERSFPRGRVGLQPLLGTVLLVDDVKVESLFRVRSRWSEVE